MSIMDNAARPVREPAPLSRISRHACSRVPPLVGVEPKR